MTKRAVFIGLTYAGTPYALPECANDAKTNAAYFKLFNKAWDIITIPNASMDWHDLMDVRAFLAAGDDVLFFYSGHGYRAKDGGKVETGIYTGQAIPHVKLMQEFFIPILQTCKQLLRVYDCCYAGSAKKARGKDGELPMPTIKCLDLGNCPAPADIEAYKPVNLKNDAIIAACRAKQYAYGAFRGGPGQWGTLDTQQHSLFSYLFASSLLWRCNISVKMSADDLAWKCRQVLNSHPPFRSWKGKDWQIADVVNNVTAKFPFDFITRR
jgi:hypothetical protein